MAAKYPAAAPAAAGPRPAANPGRGLLPAEGGMPGPPLLLLLPPPPASGKGPFVAMFSPASWASNTAGAAVGPFPADSAAATAGGAVLAAIMGAPRGLPMLLPAARADVLTPPSAWAAAAATFAACDREMTAYLYVNANAL